MRFHTLLFLALSSGPLPAAPAQVVRWCLDDKPSFYFYNKAGTEQSTHPGFVFDLIAHLKSKSSLDIKVMRRPQTACTVLLEKGEVDAVGLLSHNAEREKIGLFPMKNGEPDGDRAVIRTSYFLYTTKDKSLPWDGNLSSLKGKRLGAIDGYSIVSDLIHAGVKVETFKSLDGMISRLQKNDIDAVAVNNDMINRISDRILLHKYEPPLKTKDYFIQFSKHFQEKYPALPDLIWKEAARYLKSAEGMAAISKYEKLENFP
ncbi:MAG TPA: transporter substrate-binding domain-containing protein [Oligoflexus sp.]|uniref:substrate-binding periplasmic protein n=1 Tax=Oligoflexus sp. TaxID=1971216 RepID=UPI002D7FD052|nr:transporter substrate-binding domain-containing protein [Oligoflexus sp.]HET9238093.1 transporter substrate-binding domain-containing protein [Oligoflexus sp.]